MKKGNPSRVAFFVCFERLPRVLQNSNVGAVRGLLEGLSATAGLHRVRVVERESLTLETGIPSESGAVEKQCALLVDNDVHAVLLKLGVLGLVVLVVEIQRILETATSPRNDSNTNKRVFPKLGVIVSSFQLLGSFGCYQNRHM